MYQEEVGMGRIGGMRIKSTRETMEALETPFPRDIDKEISFFLFIRTQEEDTLGM
jgi:hypothetical protein